MVYRNSWLAGLAALAFAFLQLNELILPTAQGVEWQYIVIASLALGIIITWTALTYRLKIWLVAAINGAAALVAIVRVSVPETTTFFMPTGASFIQLRAQLGDALRLIRTGVEPVAPEAGVIVVVMLVIWAAGGLLSWGLLRGHPYVALLPPLVMALQFATMNRRPTSALTIGTFIALVALVIFAVTTDERDHTSGRMAPRGEWASTRNRPGPAAAGLLGVTILGSVFIVGALDERIPQDGVWHWRYNAGGLPEGGYGSLAYNPFIGISNRLVNNSDARAFIAAIRSEIPADQVYFRFMTLERFDGTQFAVADGDTIDPESEIWERPGHAFSGPTEPLAAAVTIDRLVMPWVPTPAVPFAFDSEQYGDDFDQYVEIRPVDGAVYYRNGTRHNMRYRVDANVPVPDLNVLATNPETGELSITFSQAIADGLLPADAVQAVAIDPTQIRPAPPNADTFLELPTGSEARIDEITEFTQAIVEGLQTKFEQGLKLEAWLSGLTYTTDIPVGHSAASVAEWLLDDTGDNYRRGYCENFSTAMAVMARTLGIHSRVVLGFTPGERNFRNDNNEVTVRDRNAHAWVELWMPSQGWVRFDPTPRGDEVNPETGELIGEALGASIDDILEVQLPEAAPGNEGGGPLIFEPPEDTIFVPPRTGESTPADTGFTVPAWLAWAVASVVGVGAVLASIFMVKRARHRGRVRRLREGDITAAWEDIVRRLDDLGRTVDPTRTPSELAASVSESMAPLAAAFGRSFYGPADYRPGPEEIAVVERSLVATREELAESTNRRRRIAATYSPVIPIKRLRRRRAARRR